MSCTCFIGKIGVGKSTLASRIAVKSIRKGKTVYTNMPDLTGVHIIHVNDLGTYNVHDGVCIWDEMGIEANNRDWKGFPAPAREWFKLSRHLHCDLYVFSQALDFDVTIPRIASEVFTLGKFGPWTIGRRWKCIRAQDVQTGYPRYEWTPSKWPFGLVCFRPRWYRYFNSWTHPYDSLPELPPDRYIPLAQ